MKLQKKNLLLMKGNEALAEAAIHAGCRFYAGYPITPQNEIPEYMSRKMPPSGGTFLQAESELASINMVFGAAASGVRAMTSSSGPGISLMQEGISFLAMAELPSVIVNVQRGGPGLGNITASQGDYYQAVKGGGHGDYRCIVYSPYNVQEMWDLTIRAFDKADQYRTPVIILSDGVIGQMMEPFIPRPYRRPELPQKDWTLGGCRQRAPRVIKTLFMGQGELEARNVALLEKYRTISRHEIMYDTHQTNDADMLVVASGIAARITLSAIKELRASGRKIGLFRPITLFPFPDKALARISRGKTIMVVEMNAGQMVDDVRLAVNGKSTVLFYGRPGGVVFTPEDVQHQLQTAYRKHIRQQNSLQ